MVSQDVSHKLSYLTVAATNPSQLLDSIAGFGHRARGPRVKLGLQRCLLGGQGARRTPRVKFQNRLQSLPGIRSPDTLNRGARQSRQFGGVRRDFHGIQRINPARFRWLAWSSIVGLLLRFFSPAALTSKLTTYQNVSLPTACGIARHLFLLFGLRIAPERLATSSAASRYFSRCCLSFVARSVPWMYLETK